MTGTTAFMPSDLAMRGVTYGVDGDGVVWATSAPKLDPGVRLVQRLDFFARQVAECWRLHCLICDGEGYVTTGFGDGGPCGRCDETGFDPDPDEADRLREKWRAQREARSQ